MNKPDLHLAVAINTRVRAPDEWFDEPDELDRVEKALESVENIDNPVEAAALLAFRVTRAQGFTEGNKRTALLLARWTLDNNGIDGKRLIDPDGRELAGLLIQAARGNDVEAKIVRFFTNRADRSDDLI